MSELCEIKIILKVEIQTPRCNKLKNTKYLCTAPYSINVQGHEINK